MKHVYYDVYEGEELILQCVTKDEINKALGTNKTSLTQYIDNEWKLLKRYTLYVVYDEQRIADRIPDTFRSEWEKAIKPFRRVIWCKDAGKKLFINKACK